MAEKEEKGFERYVRRSRRRGLRGNCTPVGSKGRKFLWRSFARSGGPVNTYHFNLL